MVSPGSVHAFALSFRSTNGIRAAAIIRLIYGASLYVAGGQFTPPDAILRGVGIFVFVAGVITLGLAPARLEALIDWWISRGDGLKRLWGLAAFAIGAALTSLLFA